MSEVGVDWRKINAEWKKFDLDFGTVKNILILGRKNSDGDLMAVPLEEDIINEIVNSPAILECWVSCTSFHAEIDKILSLFSEHSPDIQKVKSAIILASQYAKEITLILEKSEAKISERIKPFLVFLRNSITAERGYLDLHTRGFSLEKTCAALAAIQERSHVLKGLP